MAKTKRGPKQDKYQAGADAAKADRDSLNKRWASRQAELNKQQRGASLLTDALNTTKECGCGLSKWECDMLRETGSDPHRFISMN